MLTSEENETKLINNILFAASQEEVKCFIDTAFQTLEQNHVKSHIISRFIEKIICPLSSRKAFSVVGSSFEQSMVTTPE